MRISIFRNAQATGKYKNKIYLFKTTLNYTKYVKNYI